MLARCWNSTDQDRTGIVSIHTHLHLGCPGWWCQRWLSPADWLPPPRSRMGWRGRGCGGCSRSIAASPRCNFHTPSLSRTTWTQTHQHRDQHAAVCFGSPWTPQAAHCSLCSQHGSQMLNCMDSLLVYLSGAGEAVTCELQQVRALTSICTWGCIWFGCEFHPHPPDSTCSSSPSCFGTSMLNWRAFLEALVKIRNSQTQNTLLNRWKTLKLMCTCWNQIKCK